MHSFHRFLDLNIRIEEDFWKSKTHYKHIRKKYIANVNARNKNSFVRITCQVCCYVSDYKWAKVSCALRLNTKKNPKTIVDFKYQGSKPEHGLLWIMDYASGCNINENDVEKECFVVFSRCEWWHNRLLTCAENKRLETEPRGEKWAEMKMKDLLEQKIRAQTAKSGLGRGNVITTVKLNCLALTGIAYWCKKFRVSWALMGMTSFNQMFVCTCAHSYIMA